MREQRTVDYVIRFNRYYIFWEDHGQPFADLESAEREKAALKSATPYWKWKIVERETSIRERDLD